MRYKKPLLVVCTAIILVCSIPISAFAYTYADIPYFRFQGQNVLSTENKPGFHINTKNKEIICKVHCTNGSYKSFILWIPLMGYYFCVLQSTTVPADYRQTDTGTGVTRYGCYTIGLRSDDNWVHANQILTSDIEGWADSTSFNGLHSILGQRVWICSVNLLLGGTVLDPSNSSPSESGFTYSSSFQGNPDNPDDFLDEVDGLLDSYPMQHGSPVIVDGSGGVDSTYPDGTPVPTNSAGNPVPTNEFGQTMPTLPNGKPVPTYPNGSPAEYYTDASGVYHTVPYTIYDNADNASDVSDKFSKLNDMISDLDDLSSIMESNQSDLSEHVDNTRGLITTVTSWLPTPVIACLICGAIMIIAVKIAGSGKS